MSDDKRTNNSQLFWLGGALIAVLMTSVLLRDLNRPICGLHSWAEAHSSWFGRVQLKYGIGYTEGLKTWAVGDPPKEDPTRYLDHPQLPTLVNATGMYIFGWRDLDKALQKVDDPQERQAAREALQKNNDAAMRRVNLAIGLITLALLLMLLRPLLGDAPTILAALFYSLFPLTGYFGVGSWITPTALLAFWFYLVLLGGLPNHPPQKRHLWGLAITLFLMLQFSWSGFFYALAIGVHYVVRCIFHRELPGKTLLTILIAAPSLSLGLDFLIMAYGYGWDVDKIVELFKWRATTGEKKVYTYFNLWQDFWRHALTNFSPAALIAAGVGLAWQFVRWVRSLTLQTVPDPDDIIWQRRFPHLWLFLLPGVFQITMLKGCLEQHQTWEQPVSPFVAIAAALGAVLVGDLLGKLAKPLGIAVLAIIVAVICRQCGAGLDHYHSIRHYSPTMVRMWQKLNAQTPPDKKLLAWHHYTITQHESKGTHYRPEVAWYLDREIVTPPLFYRDRTGKVVAAAWPYKEPDWQFLPAETIRHIDDLAQTGQYPHYLVSQSLESLYRRDSYPYRRWLIGQLKNRYKWESIEPDPRLGRDRRYGAHVIFNLEQRK